MSDVRLLPGPFVVADHAGDDLEFMPVREFQAENTRYPEATHTELLSKLRHAGDGGDGVLVTIFGRSLRAPLAPFIGYGEWVRVRVVASEEDRPAEPRLGIPARTVTVHRFATPEAAS